MLQKIRYILIAFVNLSFFVGNSFAADVSVLVLYTEAARDRVINQGIEDRIQAYIDSANDSYQASHIDINMTLAGAILILDVDDSIDQGDQNYSTNDALADLQNGDGVFENVPGLRNRYGGDFVVLLRDIEDIGGQGYLADPNLPSLRKRYDRYFAPTFRDFVKNIGKFNSTDWAYSIVRVRNPYTTFTHEVGHNMGLAHSRRQIANGEPYRGITPYALGHGVERVVDGDNGFITIMGHSNAFNDAQEIAVISNPAINCDTGNSVHACGVDSSDPHDGADGAKVLNDHRHIYSSHRVGPELSSLSFDDANLQSCLGPHSTALITHFTNLNCGSSSIRDVEGIQDLHALRYADFHDNSILLPHPLLDLPHLQSVVLSGNDEAACTGLDQLEAKLGAANVVRPSSCFPLVAVSVAILF